MELEEAFVVEFDFIKLYPSISQQDTEVPYMVYELSSSERLQDLDTGHNGHVSAYYQFDFYHTSMSNLIALKKLILAELKKWNFINLGSTGPYIQQCEVIDYSYKYDDQTKLYVGTFEININYEEGL